MASHFQYDGPFNRNPGPNEVGIIVYGYWPSLALGLVGVITFGIALIVNTYYAIKRKGHYRTFSGLLAGGCLAEVGGYATRIFSHYKPFNLSAYIASSSMIIMAPVLFAAGIDFTLNILAEGFEGSRPVLLLSPKMILYIFISIDVFALTIQGIGAALVGYTTSSFFNDRTTFIEYEQANSILIAGLALQVFTWVVFILFVVVAIYRAYTLTRFKRVGWYDNMRYMLWASFVSAVFLLWRACYRLAEVVLGYLSGPATREDYLAAFEYLPVILAIIILTAFPPHFFVERKRKGKVPSTAPDAGQRDVEARPTVGAVRSSSSAETVVVDERGAKAVQ